MFIPKPELVVGPSMRRPPESERPSIWCKNVPLNQALAIMNPFVRNLLLTAPLYKGFPNTYVDVKPMMTKMDECVCLPGWHTDLLVDLSKPHPTAQHHLIVFGGHALTEFLMTPMFLTFYDGISVNEVRDQINSYLPSVIPATEGRWISYGRDTFHRGPVTREIRYRLLIRVTETDLNLKSEIRDYVA